MNRQAEYRSRYRAEHPGWRDSSTLFREILGELSDASTRVLDLGCGHRGLGSSMIDSSGLVIGADSDVPALSSNVEIKRLVAAHAEKLPFSDATFDLVTMRFVVEHLPRPDLVFAEAARVLAPGGRLALLTPNAWNPVTWVIRAIPNRYHAPISGRFFDRRTDSYPVQYRANSTAKLGRLAVRFGLRPERVELNGDPTYLSFGPATYAVARAMERVLETPALRGARVHIVGIYRKD
jgi:SAM-dependent methyltransferase